MNSKKSKNKNRPNKPPNPSPPQKIEEVVSIDKNPVQQIPENVESVPKIEERVPEIISEVSSHVFDREEKKEEIPKKPKRHRGKKKNQDADSQKIDLESNTVPQEVVLDIPRETPTAPKKKNKEKKIFELSDKDNENLDDQNVTKKELENAESVIKEPIVASISGNLLEQDVKSPKKKNKKKKHRTESEKSEKAEEVSYISAFQKLLKNENSEKLDEDIKPAVCEEKASETYKNINELENMALTEDNVLIKKSTKDGEVTDSSKEIVADSAKGKKKNKRDKSNSQKGNIKDIVSDTKLSDTKIRGNTENILEQIPVPLNLTDIKKELIVTENKPQCNLPENLISSQETTKSKAKIAKPVEKKQKAKESDITKDTLAVKDYEQIITDIKSNIKQDDKLNKKDMKQLQDTCQFEQLSKEKKKSPNPIKDLQTVNQTNPFSEIVETQTKKNIPEMEVAVDEIKPEKALIKMENVEKTITNVGEKSKKKEKKSPKITKDCQKVGLEIRTIESSSEIVEMLTEQNIPEMDLITNEKKSEKNIEFTEKTQGFEEEAIAEISKKKEKKLSNSKTEPQTIGFETVSQAPLGEIIETRSLEKPSEMKVTVHEEKLKEFIESKENTEVLDEADTKVLEKSKKKEKKSPKPKNDPKKIEFEVQSQAPLSEIIETRLIEKNDEKSNEFVDSTGKREVFEEAATKVVEKSKKKEKKLPKPKNDTQIIDLEIQTQAPLSEIIETRLIEKDSEKEAIEKIVETTEKAEVLKEASSKVVGKSKKKEKVSPQPKTEARTAEFEIQIQSPLTELAETRTEQNVSKLEVIDRECKTEEFVEPIVKTETYEKMAKKVVETPKKNEKRSPKSLIDNKAKTEHACVESHKTSYKESKEPDKQNTEIACNMSTLDEIEISSLKAEESEESTCDVIPDMIQYPRATSQDTIDVNNNLMSIREITFIEETQLRIPVQIPDTPLISGSGETPLDTPEIGIMSKNVNKHTTQPSDTGKTDLKSKMMELNQDMEELKLSIEKSLAELTNLEKVEEEIEKEFADKKLTITEEPQVKELKQDISTHDVNKSITEKEMVSLDVDSKGQKFTCENEPKMDSEFCEETTQRDDKDIEVKNITKTTLSAATEPNRIETVTEPMSPPKCPVRKDNKNKKSKSKKKGYQEAVLPSASSGNVIITGETSECNKTPEKEQKIEQKPDSSKENTKKQSETVTNDEEISITKQDVIQDVSEFDPIESFEDAMTSSADDINKSFEMIANEVNQVEASLVNPEINIIAPMEDKKQDQIDEKVKPVSQPKNLLGHFDIPVPSNRMDYKKEKNKLPNELLAKVKIKDSIEVEAKRQSKESQTDNIRKFIKTKSISGPFSLADENEDFVYKYSFRKVFLQSSCHVCKKDLKQSRVPCNYCSLVFYCSGKHKDEDWPQHQALCFAVSTIGHLKDQKHIYADAKAITGQNYRLLRMQMIVSCEKVLKRRLVPWEQEALLYPRICADVSCREWQQNKLVDCVGCHQISYCSAYPEHCPKSHQRWCKSYSLYQKLVSYQQTNGRLEPKLPTKVLIDYEIPDKMNEVLASMYEEKIDMSDIQYASLTQIATAPLTAAYCYQIANKNQPLVNNIFKKSSCTIHVVDAELQFEADALNKWEVFFLHLSPVDELRVVMVSTNLNPGNLPLELLSRIKLCENCRLRNRRVIFKFHDKQTYCDYWTDEDYITPNLVCAFNANISRSTIYNSKDPWPKTLNCILKQKVPFLVTAHTLNELLVLKDMSRVTESTEHKCNVIVEPKINNFASVRPDRNFITDDEMPLLFKNYCYMLLVGA